MRELVVENFISIDSARYEPKLLNVLIGEQAEGKSLLVKLDYFFQEVVDDILLDSILEQETRKEQYIERIKEKFHYYFNKRIWKNFSFKIEFKIQKALDEDFFDVVIEKNKKDGINVNISKTLNDFRKTILKDFKSYKQEFGVKDIFLIKDFYKHLQENYPNIFKDGVFIPAGRSYFSNMDKAIYMLLEKNYRIDPFLIAFGSRYEGVKDLFREEQIHKQIVEHRELQPHILQILKGSIEYSKDVENIGIKKEDVFYEVFFTSSGQQETIPLMLILLFYLTFYKRNTIYVEEPEAHLFPLSQKAMVEILAYLYNRGNEITITTHSPYVITAINNLLMAWQKKDVAENINENFIINFNELSAYAFQDGKLESIKDNELQLIDGYTLDSISEILGEEFDKLLYGENGENRDCNYAL